MINCVNSIFKNYDYHNNLIKESILNNHNDKDNAWIAIDNNVYSIRKDDILLLDIFKGLYGKNVKDFILKIDIKRRILILNRLKDRQIGKMKDIF